MRLDGMRLVQRLMIVGAVSFGGYAIATAAQPEPPTADPRPTAHLKSIDATSNSGRPAEGQPAVGGRAPEDANNGSASNNSHTEVTVNGESISVPANGQLNQTIANGNSSTNISIDNRSSSSGSNSNRTQVNIHSSSQSDSSSSVITRETRHSR